MPDAPLRLLPRPRDGDFYSQSSAQLPFMLAITEWQDLSRRAIPGVGTQETALVTVEHERHDFRTASRFVLRTILPENQRFDLAVDMMPPLATRVNGYNTYIARKLAAAGMPVRIVGTNQTRGHSMLHDAQATLTILDAADGSYSYDARPYQAGQSIDVGYSMGAMKDNAKLALAPLFGRTIRLSKQIDPCIAEPVSMSDVVSLDTAGYLLRDAAEIPRIFLESVRETGWKRTSRRMRQWIGTIGLGPAYSLTSADKWRTIITGEAGTFLPAVPVETPIVMHAFASSRLNHSAVFERQLSGFLYARVLHEPGYHLSAADHRVIENLVEDVVTAQELIREGAPKAELIRALARPLLAKR